MKKNITGSILSLIYFYSIVIATLFLDSCSGKTDQNKENSIDSLNSSAVSAQMTGKPKISFLTMGTTVAKFKKVIEHKDLFGKDFKRMICQFRNDGLNTTGDGFVFNALGYAWRQGGSKKEYFDSTFIEPVPTREQYDTFTPPYRIGNIELRDDAVLTFIKELKKNSTPLESFDSVLFRPIIVISFGTKKISLEVIPIKSLETEKNFTKITALFNPCPPAKPQ